MNIFNLFKSRKILIGIIVVFLIIIIGTATLFYFRYQQQYHDKYFGEALTNCLQIKYGNAAIKVWYPNVFIDSSFPGGLRISRRNPVKLDDFIDEYIITVDPNMGWDWRIQPEYTPLGMDKYVEFIKEEYWGDPEIVKSKLNGYDAAFRKIFDTETNSTGYQYFIPMGNEDFNLSYQFSGLTDHEKQLAEKIIQTIKVIKTNEDLKIAKVESCK